MERIVFNDSELWRFQGKTKKITSSGNGVWRHAADGKTGFKITSFQKNWFRNFSFELYKTAVNMERTRTRNGRRQMAYTLIPPKRRNKEE